MFIFHGNNLGKVQSLTCSFSSDLLRRCQVCTARPSSTGVVPNELQHVLPLGRPASHASKGKGQDLHELGWEHCWDGEGTINDRKWWWRGVSITGKIRNGIKHEAYCDVRQLWNLAMWEDMASDSVQVCWGWELLFSSPCCPLSLLLAGILPEAPFWTWAVL